MTYDPSLVKAINAAGGRRAAYVISEGPEVFDIDLEQMARIFTAYRYLFEGWAGSPEADAADKLRDASATLDEAWTVIQTLSQEGYPPIKVGRWDYPTEE